MQAEIDRSTGAKLAPGQPDACEGNGSNPDFECCCDECDYYLICFDESGQKRGQT